jgi:hypothetical protein
MTPCRVVDGYQRFGETCCLHFQDRRVTCEWKNWYGYREMENRDLAILTMLSE